MQKQHLFFGGMGAVLMAVLFLWSENEAPVTSESTSVQKYKNKNDLHEKKTIPSKMPHTEFQKESEAVDEGYHCIEKECESKMMISRDSLKNIIEDTAQSESMTVRVSVENWQEQKIFASSQLCSIHVLLEESNDAEFSIDENCDIFLYKMDGAFRSYTEEQFVEYIPNGEIEITFRFPEQRIGGMGVSIIKEDRGFAIMNIYPNTPAEEMGLQNGDIIIEVNGESTYDLSMDDFLQLTTGYEGTTAEFRLLGDDEHQHPRTFIRKTLDL